VIPTAVHCEERFVRRSSTSDRVPPKLAERKAEGGSDESNPRLRHSGAMQSIEPGISRFRVLVLTYHPGMTGELITHDFRSPVRLRHAECAASIIRWRRYCPPARIFLGEAHCRGRLYRMKHYRIKHYPGLVLSDDPRPMSCSANSFRPARAKGIAARSWMRMRAAARVLPSRPNTSGRCCR